MGALRRRGFGEARWIAGATVRSKRVSVYVYTSRGLVCGSHACNRCAERHVGCVWIPLDAFGLVWLHLVTFCCVWLRLVAFGGGWMRSVTFGYVWLRLSTFGRVWSRLD